jgi:hypothetical protein
MPPVAARLKAETVSRADEGDLRFFGVIGFVFESAQRVPVRVLRVFVDRVPYRDLSDSGRNKAVKLPAVASGKDVLVRADHHHWKPASTADRICHEAIGKRAGMRKPDRPIAAAVPGNITPENDSQGETKVRLLLPGFRLFCFVYRALAL